MFHALKGGKTTLLSLNSAIVSYLKHDMKPDSQSKSKQIYPPPTLLNEAGSLTLLWVAFDMAQTTKEMVLLQLCRKCC